MDTKRYACFSRPGHGVTGDASEARPRSAPGSAGSGCTRSSTIARSWPTPRSNRDERATTVAAFTRRALPFFEAHGIEARRLMTDNAWCYTHSTELAELLASRRIKHLTILPRRPQINGTVEQLPADDGEGVGLRLT
jgi:hypothetical protein